ncbi:MAG TPA: GNAT family N-acetyltransferase [Candidatus Binatia bacterium]|nr:GNAT family N-acetyltransferase [Candidatus Binatia bacterium]
MDDVWRRDEYEISTDPARLRLDVVHGFLRTSYWAENIPRAVVARSVRHSLNFGVYRGGEQVGYARVVTDRAVFGFVMDVFVLPPHRGRGLAKWLMATILAHPELQGFRRWMLTTKDAHGVYAQVGFTPCSAPEQVMEIVRRNAYTAAPPGG